METYEENWGEAVAREDVYASYLEFCSATGLEPTNNAALGKIFKKTFPRTMHRRLGQRNQNKMHYANIALKSTAKIFVQPKAVPSPAKLKKEDQQKVFMADWIIEKRTFNTPSLFTRYRDT